ncbi:family 16 glycosylhydrolase [Planomicrobium sp. CPCC 101079]|uniref:glycoside hydrolase family 16 protein n=1 Tax=Planomicrobium sp. CPCC 101079 TaxID=2599618 RepID=UPI0011B50E44|nr:glycoside hydrolase family 16 protein [Planomicrobium sp. CPCC 101079]TWT01502.1 glycoside hydrolase family 16 protein [Planomicrobium sp. CPCC 101079]
MNATGKMVCTAAMLVCMNGGEANLRDGFLESHFNNGKAEEVEENEFEQPWKIVWSEEFEGDALDPQRWNVLDDAFGYGARSQHYKPENVEVSEGQLKIHIKEEMSQGMPYTSGAITTRGKVLFKYGKVEVRAKLPSGTGLLPAIWFWNNQIHTYPEIDMVEILGQEPGQVWNTLHYDVNGIYGKDYAMTQFPDLTTDFHTYGIEWTPEKIVYFVDGVPTHTSTVYVPQEDMYLFINTGVGGNWVGEPDHTTVFPAQMNVDWIRYYQIKEE